MKKYEARTFDIPELKGISKRNIEEHLKLYQGYVKHTNLILDKISELKDSEDQYALSEIQRRFGFEFDGMRNHEYYFHSLEGGSTELSDGGLKKAMEEEWGDFDTWLKRFKQIAMTRGVGWAILYLDTKTGCLVNTWVDEQHLGHLTGLSPILALDMWEHSFVADYMPSGKGQYVEDFFENLNWSVIEDNFTNA
jgi:Fe-Mn family superoxide dismutase